MRLLTFLRLKDYFNERELISHYRSRGVLIFPEIPPSLFSLTYFVLLCLRYKKVIIHLKKRSPSLFDRLKAYFPNKIRYVYEGEGDPESEATYLKEHPYIEGFYDSTILSLQTEAKNQKQIFENADIITFGYSAMKDMLCRRYPELGLEKKIVLVPMTFDKEKLFYSKNAREKLREELRITDKLVMTYIGNVYYSWQNFYRSLEIIKLIESAQKKPVFSIFLISESNHEIAKRVIKEAGLIPENYLLRNVSYDLIPNYLSASDVGIALRHNHIVNNTTPSGKILDYLGCGLPVLTTSHMGEISALVKNNNFGAVIDDMDDDSEVIACLSPYLFHSEKKRRHISSWASENISSQKFMPNYISSLKLL